MSVIMMAAWAEGLAKARKYYLAAHFAYWKNLIIHIAFDREPQLVTGI